MKYILIFLSFFVFSGAFAQTAFTKSVLVSAEKPSHLGLDSFYLVTKTRVTDLSTGKYSEVAEGIVFADTTALNAYLLELEKKLPGLDNKIAQIQVEKTLLQSTVSQIETIKGKYKAGAAKPKPTDTTKKKPDKPEKEKKKKGKN